MTALRRSSAPMVGPMNSDRSRSAAPPTDSIARSMRRSPASST
jgi:hypothetical protein